jgi:hypothetical protein
MTQSILVTLYTKDDKKIGFFMPLEKNGKRRTKPQPVKVSAFKKLFADLVYGVKFFLRG